MCFLSLQNRYALLGKLNPAASSCVTQIYYVPIRFKDVIDLFQNSDLFASSEEYRQ